MVPSYSEFAQQGGDGSGSQPAWARALEAGLDGNAIGSRSNRHKQLIRELVEPITVDRASIQLSLD